MITDAPFLPVLLALCTIPLAWSWSLTPLTIDEHPCKPEKIKNQARYICDSTGKVECLTGWKEKEYNQDPHFPCAEPVCNPPCQNGECKLPNVCSCDIGWEGLDCATCIDMPGCVNGGCTKDGEPDEPLTCKCQDNWQGALCDIPRCEFDCYNNGICVDTADEEHFCKCNLGWTGQYCYFCNPLMGCVLDHTIDVDGDGDGDGCKRIPADGSNDFDNIPNTCQCTENWTGIFCEQPRCLDEEGLEEIECVNGVCTEGGRDADGNQLAAFCKCNVGWYAHKCDYCLPLDGCPLSTGDIPACINPNDCRCEGIEAEDNNEENKRCSEWIPPGSCRVNKDCPADHKCVYETNGGITTYRCEPKV